MRLSKTQLNALTLLVMAGRQGNSAYALGVSRGTLWALVRRDLATHRPRLGDMFFPRQRIFVITELGYKEHRAQCKKERRS